MLIRNHAFAALRALCGPLIRNHAFAALRALCGPLIRNHAFAALRALCGPLIRGGSSSGLLFEGRDLNAGAIIGKQLLDGFTQSNIVSAKRHVHRDHIAVDVNVFDTIMSKQSTSKFIAWSIEFRPRRARITFMTHASDRTVNFKPDHTRIR